MATITSATSGLASATSTWTGGVVPGTTFAGTRTTTGTAYAIGATTIALSAASPAVTAGKWLKFAGHTTMHRVATGLGTGAGNIVLAAPGLLESIPASATSVSVDMTDDKVQIAHPGTNTTSTAAYVLNGAASAGATTVPVTGGTGTIVAGECVQFEHQIGTDEDGQPIYDNTYYKVTTGITGAGSLVLATGLAYAMASGVRVVNRGHVVEFDIPFGVWGDDTSSTTAASNGIPVLGTLKASRSVSTTLVCRGTLFYGVGSAVDYGRPGADPMPAGVTAKLLGGDSASLSAGKHVITSHNSSSATLLAAGAFRTRNTELAGAVSAGGTSIAVSDSVGWAIGDRLAIASDTNDPARAQVVTITGGASPNWTTTAITNARAAGTKVGNLSSNVVFGSASANFPTAVAFSISGTTGVVGACRVNDVRFENVGVSSGWAQSAIPVYFGALGMAPQGLCLASAHNCATEATGTTTSCGGGPTFYVPSSSQSVARRWACKAGTLGQFTYFGESANGKIEQSFGYSGRTSFVSGFGGGGAPGEIVDCETWNYQENFTPVTAIGVYVIRGVHRSVTRSSYGASGNMRVQNSEVYGVAGSPFFGASAYGAGLYAEYSNCIFSPPEMLTGSLTTGITPSQKQTSRVIAVNGDTSDNRVLSYFQTTVTDLTTRRRSTYAVKIQPNVVSTAITYTFTIPAISGVAQTIKGSLRFDSTYGTATPPSIALSGQGVTSSFTAPATADAWHDFTLSFTPTSTGDITATVTVQSTSTSGYAWLDGIYHYPMTQSVRHYGYQWLPQAAQEADSRITLTEAAALALPIVVDHGAETITITGSATAREVFEHCIADLCQTGNQGEAVHISSATGETFETTYTVVGDVVGVYTDTTGTSASLTLSGLQDASVLLVDGSGTTVEFQAAQSGEFDYVYNFAPGATGTWRWVAKAPGREHATGTFTPGAGGAFSYAPVLTQKLTPSGDPMYTGTTSALVSVSIPGTTTAYIDIGDGTAPLQESFNETELALVTQAGLEWLAAGKDDVSVFDSGSGDYLFLTAGWRLRRASAGDANAAIEAYVTSADGVIVDDTNGPVLYLTSNTPATIAAAVWAYIDRELTQAIPTAAQIADTMLGRNLAGGSDGGRTVRDALRASRNKSAISGSTLTVYQEDDATPAWTAAVSTAERDALQSIDPA